MRKASDFTLYKISETLTLSQFKGKVIILNFWATWCISCQQEIPDFIALHNQYKEKELMVIGICLDKGNQIKVKQFIKKLKINYPIVKADNKVLLDYGNIRMIPTTFIINRNGDIIKQLVGYHSKQEFEVVIQKLLEK